MSTQDPLVPQLRDEIAELRARLADAEDRSGGGANLLDAVVSSIADGVVIYAPDGSILRSNDAARRILGHTDEQMALPFSERLGLLQPRWPSGEPMTYEESPTARALRGESGTGAIVAVRAGDTDHDIWVSLSHAPARDAAGHIVGAVITFSDVTPVVEAQHQAEHLLTQVLAKRERLFSVLSMLPGFVCLLTPEHGFAYVNDGFRRLFGDPGSRKCHETRFGRSDPCPWCESFRCLETGEPHEWEWTSRDGATFQVYDHPFVDIDGSSLVLEFGLDVTDLKRQRVDLEQTTEMLETLVETMPSGIIVADAEGNITIVNEHMRRILGGPIGPVAGQIGAGYSILHADGSPFAPDELPLARAVRQGESSRNVEMTFRRADGSEVPTVLAASPLHDRDGNSVGAVAIIRDITELYRARLELIRHRDHLEALVDERTLELAQRSLNLRSLASELALTEERQRRHIAAGIHDEISQTLAFSKLQLEGLRAAAASEEEAASLGEVVGMLARVLQYTRDLTFDISPPILYQVGFYAAIEWLGERMSKQHGYSVTVTADDQPREIGEDARIVLFQGVREILTNVAKHAQASEVTIDIARHGQEKWVVVQDNGVGFDASKPMVGGVTGGFGLFDISERLAHLGGRLSISSTPGQGSTFTLTAPLLRD